MNNNIDFSDFHKISVEHPSKCRKITKHRFEIFSILTTLIVIVLIIVYANKNKEKNKKEEELSILKKDYTEINQNLTNITEIIDEANNTNITLDNELIQIKIILSINQSELNELNKTNEILKKNHIDLSNQINNLSPKLKIINEINQKTKLKEILTQRLNNLEIKDSNIHTNVTNFENEASMKVKNKCYDSILYGFNPEMFYKNCIGTGLLFLIKTENGEKIGAYTSESTNEDTNIQDIKSILINFDKNKFYKYNMEKMEDCYVIWNLNNFPNFGGDLEINNKYGASFFPYCYGFDEELEDFVNAYEFIIDILEVYKVEEN